MLLAMHFTSSLTTCILQEMDKAAATGGRAEFDTQIMELVRVFSGKSAAELESGTWPVVCDDEIMQQF
eukprot:SAG31_NODE_5094_length_2747_cov_1.641616_4_plen_68_part_00